MHYVSAYEPWIESKKNKNEEYKNNSRSSSNHHHHHPRTTKYIRTNGKLLENIFLIESLCHTFCLFTDIQWGGTSLLKVLKWMSLILDFRFFFSFPESLSEKIYSLVWIRTPCSTGEKELKHNKVQVQPIDCVCMLATLKLQLSKEAIALNTK